MNINQLSQLVGTVSGKPVHNLFKMRKTLLAVRNKIIRDFPQSARQTDGMFAEVLRYTRGVRGKGGRKTPHGKHFVKSVAMQNLSNLNPDDQWQMGFLERFFLRGRRTNQNNPAPEYKLPHSERYVRVP